MPFERREISADALRFVIAGAINTALTVAVYEVAMVVMSPSLSYAIAWIAGLAFLVTVYPERVFPGGRKKAIDRVLIAAGYCAIFLLGLGTLQAATIATTSPRLAIVFALVATTVANFFVSRMILRR